MCEKCQRLKKEEEEREARMKEEKRKVGPTFCKFDNQNIYVLFQEKEREEKDKEMRRQLKEIEDLMKR